MPLPPSPFNTAERNLLRHEFLPRFGQAPSLADGIWLRAWGRGGPQAGQPKVPAAVASMLERGLIEIEPDRIGFRARFTLAGFAALRVMAQDRRALDPKQYAHIREELGIDPALPLIPARPHSLTNAQIERSRDRDRPPSRGSAVSRRIGCGTCLTPSR